MSRHKLRSILLLVLSGALLSCCLYSVYRLYIWSPKVEWDPSPETVIIGIDPYTEIDYNYIPDFRVWGDGYIVWIENEGGKRKVFEGYLSHDEIKQIIHRFIQANYFKGYRVFNRDDYALPHISVHLLGGDYSELIDSEDQPVYEIISNLRTGAGVKQKEFFPKTGSLVAFPVEETSVRNVTQAKYRWPDEEFGYTLEIVHQSGEKEIAGKELLFAWEIVNSFKPLVESQGKIYWIGLTIPKISY